VKKAQERLSANKVWPCRATSSCSFPDVRRTYSNDLFRQSAKSEYAVAGLNRRLQTTLPSLFNTKTNIPNQMGS
jgi:hypothetical protein